MMKNKLFYFAVLFIGISISAQTKSNTQKMGFYTNLDANIGFDLVTILRNDKNKTEYEKQQEDPGKFNYGFTTTAGFQPLKWFVLGAGFRYSYIDPNNHFIYFLLQPQFILSNPQEDDPIFLKLSLGKQINQTSINNNEFLGISLGKTEVLSPRFSHYFQVNLDFQNANDGGVAFVGVSYGVQIFSNKNFKSN
jgi:hypothetical protein